MTVTYADQSFLRLLFRWHGSLYKSIMREYLVFLLLFYIINLSYRFAMKEDQQKTFVKLVNTFRGAFQLIPIQFLLGFYVSSVVARWWQQLNYVSWPDKVLIFLNANIPGRHANAGHFSNSWFQLIF